MSSVSTRELGVGNSASKRSRSEEVDGIAVDRISDLPESVLLHILSFLSAIYVVRTSVLSRRWQYVWTDVPCLNLGSEIVKELGGREKPKNFVSRFLFQYKATSIRKFGIKSILSNSPDTESWISWAINRDVGELDISFGYRSPPHHLPQTIFGCKTLVVLKLNGENGYPVSMAFPPSACIPCLKTLELDSVTSPDEFHNKLISCCVVLENLSIRDSFGRHKSYRVHARQLKCLKIKINQPNYPYGDQKDIKFVIDINSPTLEDLDIKVTGKHSLLLANVGNLRKAEITLNNSNALQSFLKYFSALKNAKSLFLSSRKKQACNLQPGLMVHNMNLTHLTLGVRSVWVQLLPYFFRCFPNLQVLRLEKNSSVKNYAGKLCTEPKHLPRGLLSCLRLFVAEEFSGTNDELDMLEYILKNGEDLDLVRIMHCCSSQIAKEYTTRKGSKAREFEEKLIACKEESRKHELKLRVAQKILNFPRASQTCRIEFSYAV